LYQHISHKSNEPTEFAAFATEWLENMSTWNVASRVWWRQKKKMGMKNCFKES